MAFNRSLGPALEVQRVNLTALSAQVGRAHSHGTSLLGHRGGEGERTVLVSKPAFQPAFLVFLLFFFFFFFLPLLVRALVIQVQWRPDVDVFAPK